MFKTNTAHIWVWITQHDSRGYALKIMILYFFLDIFKVLNLIEHSFMFKAQKHFGVGILL